MHNALFALAALACPVGMGAMMWFMAKGMRRGREDRSTPAPDDLVQLRAEHRRLGEEIERLDTDAPNRQDELAAPRR